MKDDPWYMERKSRKLQKELEKKITNYTGLEIRLIRFIIGITGIITVMLSLFTFTVFLFLPYGNFWGSIITAFGIPLFILIIGASMIYYGFHRDKKTMLKAT